MGHNENATPKGGAPLLPVSLLPRISRCRYLARNPRGVLERCTGERMFGDTELDLCAKHTAMALRDVRAIEAAMSR